MIRLKRAQLTLHTSEGEVVTSTQLEFDGVTNEYITVASLMFLISKKPEDYISVLTAWELITKERHGQQWINVANLLPLFGWTPD